MKSIILGISAYYHDSAAALVIEGNIVAAAQEERFTRKKHDANFPANAIASCLELAGIEAKDITHVVFYDKPLLKFERLLETYVSYAPKGFVSFATAMPIWLKDKIFLKSVLRRELNTLGIDKDALPPLLFTEHHQSHAGAAFFPSPFEKAAVLCLDGVGEWATSSVWLGEGNRLTPQWEIKFPHSLGLLYSAFTYYIGFKVNSGEYKLMGLAPYGEPKYVDIILKELIDVKEDGSFALDMRYFNYAAGLTMVNKRFENLFGMPTRKAESKMTQFCMDIARSIQVVTEQIVLKLANSIHKELKVDYLCLAGGVALNCVANGKLQRESLFKDIWIQPASGDAGSALGAALCCWYEYLGQPRASGDTDAMRGSYLGPSFSNEDIVAQLERRGAKYQQMDDGVLLPTIAQLIADGKVVGWFQGQMEFGPRALGGRSIIGDPRNKTMQSQMNLKIKYRESFRPFAPAVLAEKAGQWFNTDKPSPYMLLVADVAESQRCNVDNDDQLSGIDKLKVSRSTIPAITHVDYSARLQTVHKQTNPRFHQLIAAFDDLTSCPVVVNTSFNVRGEPIVCTPDDAINCFINTEMDILVMENCIVYKTAQSAEMISSAGKIEFELD